MTLQFEFLHKTSKKLLKKHKNSAVTPSNPTQTGGHRAMDPSNLPESKRCMAGLHNVPTHPFPFSSSFSWLGAEEEHHKVTPAPENSLLHPACTKPRCWLPCKGLCGQWSWQQWQGNRLGSIPRAATSRSGTQGRACAPTSQKRPENGKILMESGLNLHGCRV